MNRRRLLSASAGLAALAASGALAQALARTQRVTLFALFLTADAAQSTRALWLEHFAEQGFTPAKGLTLTLVNATGDAAEIERLARAVVASRPDLICVAGSEWTLLFMHLTRDIPIVFLNVADPVRSGLVASFRRPGGNVTGITNRFFELQAKRLELLRDLRPGLRRIAVVHPEGPTVGAIREESESASSRLGMRVMLLVLPPRASREAIATALREAKAEAAAFTFGPEAITAEVLGDLEQAGLPAVFSDNTLVAGGALASLGERRPGHTRRAIDLAARILRGEKPATIPVNQLDKFHLAINLRTARAIGVQVPEAILLQADEVIR